jgi:glycosyltransferase involved in cell wall biosynthesis
MEGFSIVICCYNSQNNIIETLEYIRHLQADNIRFEVLVIDNGSTDLTRQRVKQYLKNSSLVYRVFDEPKVGKPYALIKGFENSQFDKVIICDDDVLLQSDYLIVANQIFKDFQNIGILGGTGLLKPTLEKPFWFDQFANAFAVGKQWDTSGDVTTNKGFLWGAGSIVNKKAWLTVKNNGFSNFYTGLKGIEKSMTGEDTELSIWIVNAGYRLFYFDKLIYIHNINAERIRWHNLLQLQVGFARSQVYLNLLSVLLENKKNCKYFDFDEYIVNNIKLNFRLLTNGFFSVRYFKILWISIIEKREGYLPILNNLNSYYKIKEYFFKRSEIKAMYDSFKLRDQNSSLK